jgi:ribonuclease G
VAITRKRVKQSLERTIGSPCPHCEATGFIKSVTTVCNEIYVEMRKMAKQMERQDILLRVNPEVGKALKAQNGRWLTEMEELTKRTIIVKSDGTLHEEQFDIN